MSEEINITIPTPEPDPPSPTENDEDVITVADKILEDTQWLKSQQQESMTLVSRELLNLKESTTQTTSEVSNLRQEVRNLSERLDRNQAAPPVIITDSSILPESTETPEVDPSVEADRQGPRTPQESPKPKPKRRFI